MQSLKEKPSVSSFSLYLQQLEGSQQLPGDAVPSVHLVVLQLGGEPGRAVVLVTHLDGGLRERPTYELCLALNTTSWQGGGAVQTVRGHKGGELDMSERGAGRTVATWCQYWSEWSKCSLSNYVCESEKSNLNVQLTDALGEYYSEI